MVVYGVFVARYMAATLSTLPKSVHTVNISFNPFHRSDEELYANPDGPWKEVWLALARTTHVRAIHLRFSDDESVARMGYGGVALVPERTIVQYAQAALSELTKVGYIGCK